MGNIGDEYDSVSSELFGAAAWKRKNISVCWENPTEANRQGREWVRKRIEGSWDYVSAIDFSWGFCSENSKGIRIRIADVRPHVNSIGRHLDGMKNGMVLNFTYKNWNRVCQDNLKQCIQATAVHEFGHALGFWHEQDRPDNPDFCTENVQSNKGIKLGPYDIHSVMNYCNPKWNNDGLLSKLDIAGVRKVYGPQGSGAQAVEPLEGPVLPVSELEPLSNDVLEDALPEDPASGYCEVVGEKRCLDADVFVECNDSAWSQPYSCAASWPGTVCNQGYCVYP